ncbi:MAG: D-glycero-beta-D-manno-heptose 1-phosphate adenylyltransferase, partial [Xanthomonadales bacterium]|nr:D-glycero-beta-D-manno-heptose 1-phosphate adenylyltransferase [Xanthomonadales bacterium]
DTIVATVAAGLASGMPMEQAVRWANIAAGIVVGKLGASSVSLEELDGFHSSPTREKKALRTEQSALELVQQRRSQGQKIVMTNGCFDLLHAGHVRYLRQARALGDFLLVAVNDDASVARLKGADRPWLSLEHRAEMLDALEFVDCVMAFSEDTPRRIIEAIKPDVLVKGADYSEEMIVGGDFVKSLGGDVVTVPLVEGCSTSALVQRIQDSNACDDT